MRVDHQIEAFRFALVVLWMLGVFMAGWEIGYRWGHNAGCAIALKESTK